jgi:hypothetical protein
METVTIANDDVEGKFGLNVEFSQPRPAILDDGFNEWGVRENDDGSVDVRFELMEPGERRGAEITPEFLQGVAGKNYNKIPVQLDHSDSQRANVGYIEGGNVGFNETLYGQAHIPNTGSSIRNDVIADFTHEPPQIKDLSAGFDPRSVEMKRPSKRGGTPEFVDARLREVSLTPFPAGYDNGGLTPEFSSAVERTKIQFQESFDGGGEIEDPESQLITRPHILIKK